MVIAVSNTVTDNLCQFLHRGGIAQQHGLPIVAGSDTHHFYQLGTVINRFDAPFETIADLKALIGAGVYTIHINEGLDELVTKARAHKTRIKTAHARGEYPSTLQ